MKNSKPARTLLRVTGFCLVAILAVLVLAPYAIGLIRPAKTVVSFSQWDAWPYPLMPGRELPPPAAKTVIRRGGGEEFFLDHLQMVMLQADEIATEMVLEFHDQAEAGVDYDLQTPAGAAQRRLAALQRQLAAIPCPQACKPVAAAAAQTLQEAERFYRVSADSGRGFSVKALTRAQQAYAVQAERCARFALEPVIPQARITAILRNDGQAIADAANFKVRATRPELWLEESSTTSATDPAAMTPGQLFDQARHNDTLLNGLWLVLDGKGYSPSLAASFHCWRSNMQAGYFGFSNWSQIPNRQYNEVRFRALQRVMDFLRAHPDNLHAQAQKEILLGLPNLHRGGMFGNSSMF